MNFWENQCAIFVDLNASFDWLQLLLQFFTSLITVNVLKSRKFFVTKNVEILHPSVSFLFPSSLKSTQDGVPFSIIKAGSGSISVYYLKIIKCMLLLKRTYCGLCIARSLVRDLLPLVPLLLLPLLLRDL
jgi:hypothetical protein